MNAHQLIRPGWTCRHDGQPWPCPDARDHLTCTYDPVTLSVVMGQYLHTAARELDGQVTPAELWSRFLEWVRHPLNDQA